MFGFKPLKKCLHFEHFDKCVHVLTTLIRCPRGPNNLENQIYFYFASGGLILGTFRPAVWLSRGVCPFVAKFYVRLTIQKYIKSESPRKSARGPGAQQNSQENRPGSLGPSKIPKKIGSGAWCPAKSPRKSPQGPGVQQNQQENQPQRA